jgi:ATP-dependent RNA helicase DeaD
MSQEQRTRVIKRLRGRVAELVIATDVAARGLDIEQLTHVINYDVPSNPDAYVHRIGRVGRAGKEGVAITLAEPRELRLVRNFEQVTKQKIPIEQVPTIADLRARRLELTRVAVRETLVAGDLEGFRVVVESLAEEFDCMTIALAAVKLAHQAAGDESEEEEIPIPAPRRERPTREGRPAGNGRGARPDARNPAKGKDKGRRVVPSGGMTRLFIGAGRSAGVRPQDLVGAIAGEAGLSGRDIGAIDIADRFSLVEVPEHMANQVIQALRASSIKGKKVKVRRDTRSS